MNTSSACRHRVALWLFLMCAGLAYSVLAQLPTPARSFLEPSRHGVHVVDLHTGKMRFIGGFYDWAVSPMGATLRVDGKQVATPAFMKFLLLPCTVANRDG